MAEADLATPADSAAVVATPPVAEDLRVAATQVEADSAAVVAAAIAVEVAVAHPLVAALQPVVAAVAAATTSRTAQRCATGCGSGLGMGRPVSTRVCSRVTRILHSSGSTTPPHVLSRTEIHATWSGPIIHAVAFVR
jgi:hypothetical protein